MNNLFAYSPKELSTDAFLAWLFRSFSVDPSLSGKAEGFFKDLGLCAELHSEIRNISTSKQEKNTDLIVRCEIDGKLARFLFENKTYSSIHSGQLDKYKKGFEGYDRYLYLKLGYVTYAERKAATLSGYQVIDSESIYQSLVPLVKSHFLVGHYAEYLYENFLKPQREIKKGLSPESFSSGQAQQYFLSALHEALSSSLTHLRFRSSSNRGGSPWTQLTIATRSSAYGDKDEAIFWRIDRRAKGYYLRLTQYSNIDSRYKKAKIENLRLLRRNVENIPAVSSLVAGKVSDLGLKSSEILVFFFVENDIDNMLRKLQALSHEFVEVYDCITSWE